MVVHHFVRSPFSVGVTDDFQLQILQLRWWRDFVLILDRIATWTHIGVDNNLLIANVSRGCVFGIDANDTVWVIHWRMTVSSDTGVRTLVTCDVPLVLSDTAAVSGHNDETVLPFVIAMLAKKQLENGNVLAVNILAMPPTAKCQ